MEKIMYSLWSQSGENGNQLRERLLNKVAPQLLAEGVHKLRVMVVDEAVAAAESQRIVNRHPQMDGMVSVWVDSAMHREALEQVLAQHVSRYEGYLVVESEPYPEDRKLRAEPQQVPEGDRSPGMCQVVFLLRPPRLNYEEWYRIWREEHGPVAYPTQSTFGYRQNTVHRVLTFGAPAFDAIIEENFAQEAVGDMDGFYAAKNNPEKRAENEKIMIASCVDFIDMNLIDCVQTSEYIVKG